MSIKAPEHWLKAADGAPLGLVPDEGELGILCDGGCGKTATVLLPEGWSVAAESQILSLLRFFCPACRSRLHG